MALRFGVDLKLFDIASKCDEHHPIDIAQLAEGTGADPLLVSEWHLVPRPNGDIR